MRYGNLRQFSILTLLLLTLAVALLVRFWPEPNTEPETASKPKAPVQKITYSQTLQFFPNAEFQLERWHSTGIRNLPTRPWKCRTPITGDGNAVWLILSHHWVGSFDGGGMTWISIQLPDPIPIGTEIPLHIAADQRDVIDDAECSLMTAGEISIFQFGNPSYFDFLHETDSDFAGSIKIVSKTKQSVKIHLNVNRAINSDRLPIDAQFDIPVHVLKSNDSS